LTRAPVLKFRRVVIDGRTQVVHPSAFFNKGKQRILMFLVNANEYTHSILLEKDPVQCYSTVL
jgi:hypothetical protein